MIFRGLAYRLKQKLNYRLAKSEIEKAIIEINRYEEKIGKTDNGYNIHKLNLALPEKFSFVFLMYDLFLSNASRLKGRYYAKDNSLLFEFGQFCVNISSASEIYIINEIFVEGCYNFSMPENQKAVVIDIGMNVGLASLFFSGLAHVEKVYSFELFTPTFKRANENFDLNRDLSRKISSHNFGLSTKNESLDLEYNTENSGINSLYNYRNEIIQNSSKEKVEIRNAFDETQKIIKANSESPIVLKIDTEGAEYGIIKAIAEYGFHENIKLIMMEWHFRGYESLVETLNTNGFKSIALNYGPNSGMIYATR